MSIRILVLVLLGTVQLTHAQTYPVKPVRIIVPFAPGGGGDFVARLLGQKMGESWGQQVIIENRGGASGNIGAEAVAKAAPDGYTILLAASSFVVNPNIYKSVPYDAVNDFTAITQTTVLPNFLVVHPSLPVKSVKELIALAKARPGQLVFGSAGVGTGAHLAGEMLKLRAGIEMVHVAYSRGGGGAMLTDLLGGQVVLSFASLPTVSAFIRDNRLRALGVASDKRWPTLPAVPTIAESGFPNFEMSSWMGFLAPAGTPKDIVSKIHLETTRILKLPDVRERSYTVGAEPVTDVTPEQFAQYIRSELVKYADIVKRAGIRIE